MDARRACAAAAGLPLGMAIATTGLAQKQAPGELDHAAADPGVACSGEPLFPPLLSSRRSLQQKDAGTRSAQLAEAFRVRGRC
jgi:hypothetical protein